jgi:hypothetical protein
VETQIVFVYLGTGLNELLQSLIQFEDGIIHTYYQSRFIPEGIAEHLGCFSQTLTLPKLLSYEEYSDLTCGKPIVI